MIKLNKKKNFKGEWNLNKYKIIKDLIFSLPFFFFLLLPFTSFLTLSCQSYSGFRVVRLTLRVS